MTRRFLEASSQTPNSVPCYVLFDVDDDVQSVLPCQAESSHSGSLQTEAFSPFLPAFCEGFIQPRVPKHGSRTTNELGCLQTPPIGILLTAGSFPPACGARYVSSFREKGSKQPERQAKLLHLSKHLDTCRRSSSLAVSPAYGASPAVWLLKVLGHVWTLSVTRTHQPARSPEWKNFECMSRELYETLFLSPLATQKAFHDHHIESSTLFNSSNHPHHKKTQPPKKPLVF